MQPYFDLTRRIIKKKIGSSPPPTSPQVSLVLDKGNSKSRYGLDQSPMNWARAFSSWTLKRSRLVLCWYPLTKYPPGGIKQSNPRVVLLPVKQPPSNTKNKCIVRLHNLKQNCPMVAVTLTGEECQHVICLILLNLLQDISPRHLGRIIRSTHHTCNINR